MKDYKWLKGVKYLLAGFIVGLASVILVKGPLKGIEEVDIDSIIEILVPYLFIAATIFCIIGLGGYFYFNRLFKKDGYSCEEDSLYDRNEKKMSIIMSFCTFGIIMNFTAFGLNLAGGKEWVSEVFILIFMINAAMGFMGEVSNMSIIKKVRPELNADPMDKDFKKEYFKKLDEREQFQVGKSSFQTVNGMLMSYIAVLLLCYFMILTFEVTSLICLPVGVLWMIQTIMLLYYGNKEA